jgi:hypothetical protein
MRTLGLIVLLALAAASCDKSPTAPSEPTNPGTPTATVVGTWRATRAEYVSVRDPNLRVEVISQGINLVIVFDSATCTWTYTWPGRPPYDMAGNWSLGRDDDGKDILHVTWTSGNVGDSVFKMTLNRDVLALSDGHLPYDFKLDGPTPDDEALLSLTLARQ